MDSSDPNEPTEYPIDGVLDLHVFEPSVIGDLVPDYLRACHAEGIYRVRIIHGKGTGRLRQGVVALLERDPLVLRHRPATDKSSWGATIAFLDAETDPEPA